MQTWLIVFLQWEISTGLLHDLSSSACQELKSNKALLAKRDWF